MNSKLEIDGRKAQGEAELFIKQSHFRVISAGPLFICHAKVFPAITTSLASFTILNALCQSKRFRKIGQKRRAERAKTECIINSKREARRCLMNPVVSGTRSKINFDASLLAFAWAHAMCRAWGMNAHGRFYIFACEPQTRSSLSPEYFHRAKVTGRLGLRKRARL